MNELMIGKNRIPAQNNPANVYIASLSKGSQRTMISALENIAQIFNLSAMQFDWTKIRYQHVQTIRASLSDHYAPATANRHLAALRGVLKENWRLGYMNAEEYQRATDFKIIKGFRELAGRYIQEADVQKLIEHCYTRGRITGIRDAAMIGMLYVCGLRRDELVSLSIGDYADGEVRVIGKGNKERFVAVNKQLQQLLAEWVDIRGRSDGALFVNVNTMQPLTTQAVYTMLKRRGKVIAIEALSPHDFRHTFISNLFDAGVDISTIANLAGHDDVETTRRYDRRDRRAGKAAVEKLNIPGIK